MKKRVFALMLVLIFFLIGTGCQTDTRSDSLKEPDPVTENDPENAATSTETEQTEKAAIGWSLPEPTISLVTLSEEEMAALANPNYASEPFPDVQSKLPDYAIRELIDALPSDRYEVYPDFNSIPTTAVLYRGGIEQQIDVRDPRLIRLINLYSRSSYYGQNVYLQGLYDAEDLQKRVTNSTKKLVLKFDPNIKGYVFSGDTLVITNLEFIVINNRGHYYDNENCPFAGMDSPLNSISWYHWLDLFGF